LNLRPLGYEQADRRPSPSQPVAHAHPCFSRRHRAASACLTTSGSLRAVLVTIRVTRPDGRQEASSNWGLFHADRSDDRKSLPDAPGCPSRRGRGRRRPGVAGCFLARQVAQVPGCMRTSRLARVPDRPVFPAGVRSGEPASKPSLLAGKYPYRHPDPFGFARDLGHGPARCSCTSGGSARLSSAQLTLFPATQP
jgi:hypothetical protein